MPKKAVERLQNIEKEIKTVISIYDTSIQSGNDKSKTAEQQHSYQFSENCSANRTEDFTLLHEFWDVPISSQTTIPYSIKKTGIVFAGSPKGNHSGESMLNEEETLKNRSSSTSATDVFITTESEISFQPRSNNSGEKKAKKKDNENPGIEIRRPASGKSLGSSTSKSGKKKASKIPERTEKQDDVQKLKVLKLKVKPNNQSEVTNEISVSPEEDFFMQQDLITWEVPVRSKSRIKIQNSKEKTVIDITPTICSPKRSEQPAEKNPYKYVSCLSLDAKLDLLKKNEANLQENLMAAEKEGKTPTNNQENMDNKEMENCLKELSRKIEINDQKLEKLKEFKALALDIAKQLKAKYQEIQNSRDELLEKMHVIEKNNTSLKNEITEVHEAKKKLQLKLDELMNYTTKFWEQSSQKPEIRQNQNLLNFNMGRCVTGENALEDIKNTRTPNKMTNEEILTEIQHSDEKNSQLLAKFNDVNSQLNDREAKIKLLEENVRQLEEEVENQKHQLQIKTETLRENKKELEMIRKNSMDLEEQVKSLKKNIQDFDGIHQNLKIQAQEYEKQIKSNQNEINELQTNNKKLREMLENEKDGLRIKIKIIDDQQETIKQLKEKSEQAKTLQKKNESLERILNVEREEKQELKEAVERLKWRKDELKKKVRYLENDFLLSPEEVLKDLQKTQIVLQELENHVQKKQKEWELQLQSLVKEKQQACCIAEFATKKLLEKSDEFQKQSQAYKQLQKILAESIGLKENCKESQNLADYWL